MPKGTLVIRAAEQLGIAIPRFCDHPLLDPVGACRQCMVEIPDAGNGRGFPKPQASCTIEVAPGMKVNTQLSSPVAAQGAGGHARVPAHQPPARLSDLRQGRRVPPAEPVAVARLRREPLRRREAHLPEADQRQRAGAARPRTVRAVRAVHPVQRADLRRPVHRPRRAGRAAAGRLLRGPSLRLLLLGQRHPDLPGRRADQLRLPFPEPSVRPRERRDLLRALRRRLRAAHRSPALPGEAPARGQRPRGQRGVELRQGSLRLLLRPWRRPGDDPTRAA